MASTSIPALRRSLLYGTEKQVPASSSRFLQKSLTLRADTIIYDLEDSVTNEAKISARENLLTFLQATGLPTHAREIGIRINPVYSEHLSHEVSMLDQLSEQARIVVIPKVRRASDIHHFLDLQQRTVHCQKSLSPGRLKILALIESAEAVMNLPEICKASPHLDGLIFGAEDFALDLSITRTPSLTEFLYARSAIVTAARAHNLPTVVDLVCTKHGDKEADVSALRHECVDGKGLGFNGKQCIHPSQTGHVESAFSPSPNELEWAIQVEIENRRALEEGRGAFSMNGKMIDAPVISRASALVQRAKLCGLHTSIPRDKQEESSGKAV